MAGGWLGALLYKKILILRRDGLQLREGVRFSLERMCQAVVNRVSAAGGRAFFSGKNV